MLSKEQKAAVASADLVEDQVEKLLIRASKEVEDGLLSAAQVALARKGKIVVSASYGEAQEDSLFSVFSATKAITSTAAWLLVEDGSLDVSLPVTTWVPEFVENNKENVIIEQLFTHMAGFPSAPFLPFEWDDKTRRHAKFQRWRLNWPPGSKFEYHPSSSMYVIADIIERITGQDWREFARQKIIEPLKLNSLHLGLPEEVNSRVVPCNHVGKALTEDDYRKLGAPVPPVTEVTEDIVLSFNQPLLRAVGIPGGGAISDAASLALFYQALLRDGKMAEHETELPRIWQPETVHMGLRVRTNGVADPVYGKPANYALGLVIAGDKTRNYRGFGHTNSASAFGHNGAGGQVAWADPQTGLSFVYCTNSHDRNAIRQGRRCVSLSNLAAACEITH